ncbi:MULTISPECIES: hypothetical protein [unclassified Roseibium]|uniref:hypothetical protein n=1 Tax=unclassified Roseibium TaxID=2629323 RepID=UPI00273FCB9B|nr:MULTISPECIES: hypothetical protein [unclassified Roseibium]
MSYAITSLIQATAPYALLGLSGLCLAATHFAERRRQKADAGKKASVQSFGVWPEGSETSPKTTRSGYLLPAANDQRVKLGPARFTSSREAGPLFLISKDRKA